MSSNLVLIDEVAIYDWDWSTTAAFIDLNDGRFRGAEDGGCSCNGPWENWSDSDYGAPLSAKEACAEIMKCGVPYGMSVTDHRSECLKVCDSIKRANKAYKAGTFREEDFG